ncbi:MULTISPECIES: transcriptional regulator [unclassified Streptomyces]|uniref:transcriptional regulator n=1 Tax=unclassified Streptomyces TaxID=2593676 RepID=UPI0022B6A81D|nr:MULTISPECIES: transcriptional regulator [unclassified Streptomyces]MCZ7415808.1 transcriptional regulator [Streptomyces sp. WMMC897]MCZ7434381.1 transcriptional regulator [Streptomyces sp. WMMC1477]
MTPTAERILGELSADRATGALTGPGGTLYLHEGEIAYAESPLAPGVEALLTAEGRVARAAWQRAAARQGPRRTIARRLVESGSIPRGELEIRCVSALFDAAYFVLAPESDGGPGRFRPGAEHWLGAVRPVAAAVLAREIRRRRRLLEDLWPGPGIDTRPVVIRPGGTARVSPRQRAVLTAADGCRTPAEIARLLGRPAFHTLVDIRRLAAAGHLAPGPEPPDEPARAPRWVTDISAGSGADDIALLRRIRDGLEARL